jgi:TrmH family RNA methyltransferase
VIEALYLCPEVAAAPAVTDGAAVFEVSRAVFSRIAMRDDSGGVVALARAKDATLEGLALGPRPLVVVLEGVEKPGNLGAILRTADAVGAAAVVVCDPRCDLWNPNVIRASVGTVFTVPSVTTTSDRAISRLHARGLRIAAATPEGATPLWDAALEGPLALVFGTEHEGLGAAWLAAADVRVQIPMRGQNDSLNVSVAVGVLAYEALRRR